MIKRICVSFFALVATVMMATPALASQTIRQAGGTVSTQAGAASTAGGGPQQQQQPGQVAVVPLPASDAVMFVNMRRLLTDAMPRVLASDSAKLARVNADIDNFKARTGIDARAFDRIAVGARFTNPSAGVMKVDNIVAIAQGSFDASVLAAAGRLAANGKYQELTHGGKTIYVINLNERVKLFGLIPGFKVSDLALAVLDRNTLAAGDPAGVRAAIDAHAGRGRVNPALITLAHRDPQAIIGFGGNLPPALLKNLDLGNEEIAKSVASIRQFYGSLGTTENGFGMLTVLRTDTTADAKNLSDTLAALKQLAPLLLAQMAGERGTLAQSVLNSLKITAQGDEVQLSLALAQTDIARMVRIF